jgi:hypothetical protein
VETQSGYSFREQRWFSKVRVTRKPEVKMIVAQILVLVALLIVAAYAAMVFLSRQRRAKYEINNEVGLFEELRQYIVTFEFTAAYIHAYRTGTPISRVVGAGLERFDTGKEAVFEAMREAITDEQTRWQESILRLFICGLLASGFGLIGVLLNLPQALASSSLLRLAPAGLIALFAVGIAAFAFVGHGVLLRGMKQSQTWLEETATEMLNNAARVAALSTRITAPSVPEPRLVARVRS